jgi:SAM-dependent methyltransferase
MFFFINRTVDFDLPKLKFFFLLIGLVAPLPPPPPPPSNKKKVWCDIGCGVGELLVAIESFQQNKNEYEAVGIESDPRALRFGRGRNLNIIEGFLDPDNPRGDLLEVISTSNIVSMFNVLEHIEHPNRVVDIFKKYMKAGSFLVIEVPRHPSLASFSNLISPQLTYRHIAPPVHLQIFSEKAMGMLVKDSFHIIGKWGFGQGFTDILTSMMFLGNKRDLSLYQQLMDISNDVQKVIDIEGYSDTMIFVMQKY